MSRFALSPLYCGDNSSPYLEELALRFQLEIVDSVPDFHYLNFELDALSLIDPSHNYKPIIVDFLAGKNRHRELFGGGKNQLICKAVGLASGFKPSVLDMTAGLGADGFVLSSFGCNVLLQERHPMVAALLYDGIRRLKDADTSTQLSLSFVDSSNSSSCSNDKMFDVVYLDPMYPDTRNKAAANKEMTVFKHLVGKDEDAANLLDIAKPRAKYRVVVKRPKKGELLGGVEPTYQLMGKSSRYDIYVNRGLTK